MKMKNIFAAAVALTMVTQSVFAQNSLNLIVLKKPTKVVNTALAHGGQFKVRTLLNDLNPGDYVARLEVDVKGGQLGSKMELFADQNKIGEATLFGQFRKETFTVKMRNGVDYQKLILRSIGTSTVQRITAVVADQNSDMDDDELLPPLPPPPLPPPPGEEPPPVVIVQPAPPIAEPGVSQFNANCKTNSAGITFYAQSEQGAFNLCNNATSFYHTNSSECFALTECRTPEMQCTSSGAVIAVIAYSRNSVIQKCMSHPVVIANSAANQCQDFARCPGDNNNGPIITFPQPPPPQVFGPSPNEFDSSKPCQTKSNGYKFSAFSRGDVVARCISFSPVHTDRIVCRDNSFCAGQQGGPIDNGPGDHFGHDNDGPGHGGHFGPVHPGFGQGGRCIAFSRGRIFVGGSFQQVSSECHSNEPATNNQDCNLQVFCSNVGQPCLSFSRNIPFFSISDFNQASSQCRANGITSNAECDQTARCY